MKERINWIDWAKAWCMTVVVFDHTPHDASPFLLQFLAGTTLLRSFSYRAIWRNLSLPFCSLPALSRIRTLYTIFLHEYHISPASISIQNRIQKRFCYRHSMEKSFHLTDITDSWFGSAILALSIEMLLLPVIYLANMYFPILLEKKQHKIWIIDRKPLYLQKNWIRFDKWPSYPS